MKYFIVIFLILATVNTYAQNQYIPFKTDVNPTNIITASRIIDDNGLDGISVEYNFDGARIRSTMEQGQSYQYFYIKDFSQTQEVGKPMLPAHTDLIFIPQGVQFNIQIIDTINTFYSSFNILPCKKQASDQFGSSSPIFIKDSIAYQNQNFYPKSPVELKGIIEIAGLRYAMIEVHPIQYRAVNGDLITRSKIKYRVSFIKASSFLDFDKYSYQFLDIIPNAVLNSYHLRIAINHYKALNPISRINTNDINLLILTQQDYKSAADTLAKWKRQLGYGVKVLNAINWTTNSR